MLARAASHTYSCQISVLANAGYFSCATGEQRAGVRGALRRAHGETGGSRVGWGGEEKGKNVAAPLGTPAHQDDIAVPLQRGVCRCQCDGSTERVRQRLSLYSCSTFTYTEKAEQHGCGHES